MGVSAGLQLAAFVLWIHAVPFLHFMGKCFENIAILFFIRYDLTLDGYSSNVSLFGSYLLLLLFSSLFSYVIAI